MNPSERLAPRVAEKLKELERRGYLTKGKAYVPPQECKEKNVNNHNERE